MGDKGLELLEKYQDELIGRKLNSQNIDPDSDLSDSEILQQLEDEIENGNDGFIDNYRAKRLEQLSTDLKETRKNLREDPDTGMLVEIHDEGQLMRLSSTTPAIVIHFYQAHFRTCSLLNSKLEILASKNPGTKFVFISATKCPFLVTKLKIDVLPCVITYVKGVETGRLVGLQGLKYDERTGDLDISLLENYLYNTRALQKKAINIYSVSKDKMKTNISNDDDDEDDDDFFD
ncbi:Plp1 protein [Saccharomycopsis crataegensis]|uniref:Plp1 protein n=1 Tax=Saccharomycopsis crataegensis TaxID=43959 RepID=A0AAV5QDI3_9ASCO|nr:Plp1 protein [Saccharomycopsis crataegensis]